MAGPYLLSLMSIARKAYKFSLVKGILPKLDSKVLISRITGRPQIGPIHVAHLTRAPKSKLI